MPEIGPALLAWYRRRNIALPWRDHPDPWAVWVSEVMLQQTTVSAVRSRFATFLKRFPSPQELAQSSEEEMLSEVQGLGYYRRFRGLRRAAQVIVAQGGALPTDANSWRALPGVGDYTAGAIASIALGEAVPAVDGNVLRVVARHEMIDERIDRVAARRFVTTVVQQWIPKNDPGGFNQALFDLGREVCRPREARCEICPLSGSCRARGAGRPLDFPVVKPKAQPLLRVIAVALIESRDAGSVLWEKRPEDASRMPGFWQLPEVWAEDERSALRELEGSLRDRGLKGAEAGPMVAQARHTITKYRLDCRLYVFTTAQKVHPPPDFRWVGPDLNEELPRSTVSMKLLAAHTKTRAADGDRDGNGAHPRPKR